MQNERGGVGVGVLKAGHEGIRAERGKVWSWQGWPLLFLERRCQAALTVGCFDVTERSPRSIQYQAVNAILMFDRPLLAGGQILCQLRLVALVRRGLSQPLPIQQNTNTMND